jgi:hypothetical protein
MICHGAAVDSALMVRSCRLALYWLFAAAAAARCLRRALSVPNSKLPAAKASAPYVMPANATALSVMPAAPAPPARSARR